MPSLRVSCLRISDCPLQANGPAPATTERFVYDNEHIALVFDGNGELTHRYLHGPIIDQVLAEETQPGQVVWALADHQGTVRDLIDHSGVMLNHLTYDSFGQMTQQTNATTSFRFTYTGRELDPETEYTYYRNRYYMGEKFISEDPTSFASGDVNLYRYVKNSPINATDPTGLQRATTIAPPAFRPTVPKLPIPSPSISIPLAGAILNILINAEPVSDGTIDGKIVIDEINAEAKKRRKVDEYRDRLVPDPKSKDPNTCKQCNVYELDRHLGGNRKGSNYATYVTGSKGDFLIEAPSGHFAFFDGLVTERGALAKLGAPTERSVAEAKAWNYGMYGLKNPRLPALAKAALISEVAEDLIVARQCKYSYSVALSSRTLYYTLKNKFLFRVPTYHIPFANDI